MNRLIYNDCDDDYINSKIIKNQNEEFLEEVLSFHEWFNIEKPVKWLYNIVKKIEYFIKHYSKKRLLIKYDAIPVDYEYFEIFLRTLFVNFKYRIDIVNGIKFHIISKKKI